MKNKLKVMVLAAIPLLSLSISPAFCGEADGTWKVSSSRTPSEHVSLSLIEKDKRNAVLFTCSKEMPNVFGISIGLTIEHQVVFPSTYSTILHLSYKGAIKDIPLYDEHGSMLVYKPNPQANQVVATGFVTKDMMKEILDSRSISATMFFGPRKMAGFGEIKISDVIMRDFASQCVKLIMQ